MSNPVIANIDRQAAKYTPAGYPTMPGYTPGQPGAPGAAPAQGAPGQAPGSQWDAQTSAEWESRLQMPAPVRAQVDPVTMDDVIVRTGALFVLLLAAAATGWVGVLVAPELARMTIMGGFVVGLVLALVISFKKRTSPALICLYAIAEGLALGSLSAFFEFVFPGIVVQAVLATLCVFAVTLVLFKMGVVRASGKLVRIVMIGLVGLICYSLASMLLSWAGLVTSPMGLDGVRVFGFPLGIVVGVVAVLLGAASLVLDFDVAVRCVEARMPKVVAWQIGFGLMVTVVWLYLELLRLIAILRSE